MKASNLFLEHLDLENLEEMLLKIKEWMLSKRENMLKGGRCIEDTTLTLDLGSGEIPSFAETWNCFVWRFPHDPANRALAEARWIAIYRPLDGVSVYARNERRICLGK